MRNRVWKTVIAGMGLMLPLTACDDNPLDESIDEVASLTFDRTFMTILPNDSAIAVVTPKSVYGDPVTTADVEFEACSTGVPLTVAAVSDTTDATLSGEHEVVIRTGGQLGYGCIVATGGGETDTLRVLVVPDEFLPVEGSVVAGSEVRLYRATGQPVFDANTHVYVNDIETWVTSLSADTIAFYLPSSVPVGEAEISLEGVGPGNVTLPARVNVTATGDPNEPDEWLFIGDATAYTEIEVPAFIVGDMGDGDVNDIYGFTLTEARNVDFTLDWVGSSGDLDFILRTPTGALVPGCNAATAAHPEHDTCALVPGTYYAQINDYEEAGVSTYVFDVHFVE